MSTKSSPRPPARPRVGKNAIGDEYSRSHASKQTRKSVSAGRKPGGSGREIPGNTPGNVSDNAPDNVSSANSFSKNSVGRSGKSYKSPQNRGSKHEGSKRKATNQYGNSGTRQTRNETAQNLKREGPWAEPKPSRTTIIEQQQRASVEQEIRLEAETTALPVDSSATVSEEPPTIATPLIYKPSRRGLRKDDRPTIVVGLPAGWARALASGIEAVLLSWGVPVMCAILGFWMISTNPWIGDSTWRSAMGFGTDLWALSLGASIRFSGVELSMIPLLWTALQVLTLRGLQMRGRSLSPNAQWIAGGSYVLGGLLIAVTAGETITWYSTLPGLLIVGFGSALWAVLAQSAAYPAWMNELDWVWRGLRVAAWWLLLAFLAGVSLVIAATICSLPLIQQIYTNLGVVSISGWLLTALQACYLPNLAAFAFAWVSGGGFYLDEGMVHSIFVAPGATLPQLPVSALVPASAPGAWPILVMIGIGVVIGCVLTYKWRKMSYPKMLRLIGVALLCFLVLLALWLRLSAGGLGTGRLVFMGPVTLRVLGHVILQFMLPLFLCLAILHSGAVRGYVRAYAFLKQRLLKQYASSRSRKDSGASTTFGARGQTSQAAHRSSEPENVESTILGEPTKASKMPRISEPARPIKNFTKETEEVEPTTKSSKTTNINNLNSSGDESDSKEPQ